VVNGADTPPRTQRAAVKIWGTPSAPRWSVTVYLGDTRAELFALVDLALDTHAFVGQRLAERRRQKRARV
jgi:hypothetical protein